jgi:sugar lactone lactonase YvrE
MSASFEVLAEGFQFVEAPRVDDDGTLYFSDLTGGGYYRLRPGFAVQTLLPDRMWIGGGGNAAHPGQGGIVRVKADIPGLRPYQSRCI